MTSWWYSLAAVGCIAFALSALTYAGIVRTRLAVALKRQRGLLRNNHALTKTIDNLADVAQDQNDRVVAALAEVCAGLKAYSEDRSMRAAELADVLLGVHKLLADEEGPREEIVEQPPAIAPADREWMWKHDPERGQ